MTNLSDPGSTARSGADRCNAGSLVPASGLAVFGLGAVALLTLTAGKQAPGQYLVMTAPSLDHGIVVAAIHRAGAGVVALGALPNVAIAWSDDPGFPDAARAQGAWLVAPASTSTGCASASTGGQDDR